VLPSQQEKFLFLKIYQISTLMSSCGHYCNVMPIMKWKWSISSKYEVLSLEKVVQIRGVIPHYLTHMVQSVALKKGIHEEIVRILGDLAHRCPFVEGSEALLRYRNFDSCSTSPL
jgi:hypothetical protein